MSSVITNAKDIDKKNRWPLILVLFIPCLIVLFKSLDNDIWFLLNHGRYVLENGIPHTEPFTIHQGFHFVMQQWLSAVLFWLAYSSFHEIGVKLLVMLFFMLLVFILYKLCMRISGEYFFLSYIITLFESIIFIYFMVSRPYIFSVVVFALEFFLLESYKERNRRVFLYFLPALSVLLINLHAAMWPMFFVFAIPYIIETIKFKVGPIVNGGAEKKWLYFTVLLSVPAGLINPYGVEAMIYGIKSYGHGEINGLVSEMRPLTIDTMFGKLMFVLMLIVPVIYFTYRRGTLKLRYVLLAMGTAYMALSSRRNIILFALCAYFPLASYLKDFTIVIKKQSNEKKVRKLRITLAVLLVIALPFGFYAAYISNKPVADEYVLLNAAIDRILAKHEPREVILYTGYNEGNLAEFRGLKTYMDARAEVFLIKNNKKEDVFHEYYNLYANKLYFSAFLDKYNFTHILLPQDGAFTEHLNYENKYSLVYSNEKYCLYEINDDDTAAVDIES